jgi:hypothetical protein
MTDAVQTPEQEAALVQAEAAKPSDETLRRLAASVPPLVRDEDHSFVEADDTDIETDPDLITPVGDGVTAPLGQKPSTVEVTRADRAGSTYRRSTVVTEADLERMSDEQIKESGLLDKGQSRVPPSRLQHGSRPRQPGQYAPAAGAGTWPMNESQMPAVMPTDPPLEDNGRKPGDNTFAAVAGFKQTEDGSLVRNGLEIKGHDVSHAASLYLMLRQQFPAFTREQLADEFEVQWLSGRSGAPLSHRAGEELSTNGLTATGDDRVQEPVLGEARKEASKAEPAAASAPASELPEAGLPSANEPASTAVDAAKTDAEGTTEADRQSVAETRELAPKEQEQKAEPPASKPADDKGPARP